MNKTISSLSLGTKAVIVEIKTAPEIKNRLISMGLFIGCNVYALNRTKIGQNVVIEAQSDYNKIKIVLNKKEADLIIVDIL
jgi:Fe2+ transport system protein FeoA